MTFFNSSILNLHKQFFLSQFYIFFIYFFLRQFFYSCNVIQHFIKSYVYTHKFKIGKRHQRNGARFYVSQHKRGHTQIGRNERIMLTNGIKGNAEEWTKCIIASFKGWSHCASMVRSAFLCQSQHESNSNGEQTFNDRSS